LDESINFIPHLNSWNVAGSRLQSVAGGSARPSSWYHVSNSSLFSAPIHAKILIFNCFKQMQHYQLTDSKPPHMPFTFSLQWKEDISLISMSLY
jgi:hypothetical protein